MPIEESDWEHLSNWWRDELADDPAYTEEVEPLVLELLDPQPGQRYLDVGCGEGRLMRAVAGVGAEVVGVDILQDLLEDAPRPTVRLELPALSAIRNDSVDGAYVSLVLEHLADESAFFDEIARVIRPGSPAALVINHPVFTAPGSAPIQEPDEILWRPGRYFERGFSDENVGGNTVRFHHRPLSALLSAAAAARLLVERVVEMGVSDAQVARTPILGDQRHIPRLLGVRWVKSST